MSFNAPDCCGLVVGRVLLELIDLEGEAPEGSILNVYTLVILSLIGDLLVEVVAPYLKVIVALVEPGEVALYVIPERFGLNIGDCSPGFRVTSCGLHVPVVV
jgi:hypothetical protein